MHKIKLKCQEVEDLLIQKNDAYGDSALNPVGIFSSLKASEAIRIRLDDKLKSRLLVVPQADWESDQPH